VVLYVAVARSLTIVVEPAVCTADARQRSNWIGVAPDTALVLLVPLAVGAVAFAADCGSGAAAENSCELSAATRERNPSTELKGPRA
jgi:hypothetical protein